MEVQELRVLNTYSIHTEKEINLREGVNKVKRGGDDNYPHLNFK